ncbi:ferredoxin-type protein NapF [Rhodobacteraceae bacterium F11138]|nr:ferredoxin-type protein NapF [Rhodobacteraceae bacterium F11138]
MPADASPALTRRAFLTSRAKSEKPAFRPPWSDEPSVATHCTGCSDCITACPQGILINDSAGRPQVVLNGGECTFCAACATACAEPVFDLTQPDPWPVHAHIGGACLLAAGISCQLCTDLCDATALRMDLAIRPVGAIHVDSQACTGCGACLAACPTQAIALVDARQTGQRT